MKLFVFVAAMVLLSAGCSTHPEQSSKAAAPLPKAPENVQVDAGTRKQLGIQVQPAVSASVTTPVTATGQLNLNEDRTWKVGSVTAGRIVAVPVHLGDTVRTGQVLAQMHSHEVHDSRADRRQAIAEWNRSKLLLDQALRIRNRTRRLYDLKAASREQLEGAETQYQSAQLSVTNSQAEVDKADAHLTEFLEVPLNDAGESSGPDADRVPIKSPASGTVMERSASVGAVVSSGDPVVTVSDLSSLWLIAAVNEADLAKVRVGQPVRILVRAYPDKIFPGHVARLGERMDAQTRTLQIRILVSNSQQLLKPDMFATVEFAPASERTGVHVPESAVQEWKGKPVVFVQTSSGGFDPRPVEVGERVNQQVRILSGLEAGTPVVVNGALLLKSQLLKANAD